MFLYIGNVIHIGIRKIFLTLHLKKYVMAHKNFYFNPETLSISKEDTNSIEKFAKKILLRLVGSFIIGVSLFLLASYTNIVQTPQEKALTQENELLRGEYEAINQRFYQAEKVIDDIQKRDDNIYRAIFGAEPIPKAMRIAGVGGTKRFKNLKGKQFPIIMKNTLTRLDKLTEKIYVQTKSYAEVIDLVKDKQKMLTSIPAIQPVKTSDLLHVPYGYGPRIDPIYKTPTFHHGMDFSAPIGTPIYATGDGTVVKIGNENRGFGKYIKIKHGFGYKTVYANLSKINVRTWQKIKRGEVIGLVGNTGKSVGSHLHYEVHVKGKDVNPINYFFNDLSPQEYDVLIEQSMRSGQAMD